MEEAIQEEGVQEEKGVVNPRGEKVATNGGEALQSPLLRRVWLPEGRTNVSQTFWGQIPSRATCVLWTLSSFTL